MSTGFVVERTSISGRLERWDRLLKFARSRSGGLASISSILVGLVIWEFAAQFIVRDKLFLVAPSAVLQRAIELATDGSLANNVMASFMEFLLGFSVAAAIGVLLGLILGTSAWARTAISPWVSALYATPIVALSPLLILWFGLGLTSKIVVVFLVSVFPVLVNTQTGIESADERLIETARAFGASRIQVFTKILLPAAVPFIVAGLRLGVGRALVGVVVAELFGARAGLGYMITVSSSVFDMGALFAAVVILAASGVISNSLLKVLEQRLAPWRTA